MIKTLTICGFKFHITHKPLVVEGGDSCLGCCKSDNNSIEIKKGIVPSRENEVILHESIHAISDIMNLDLSENQVNTLGVCLTKYIAENKSFTRKILKEN